MTAHSQADVDDPMEYARQSSAGPTAPTKPVALPTLRRRQGHLGAAFALLFNLAFWAVALICIANGWGWQFVLGAGLFASALVLWVRRPWKRSGPDQR